MRHAIPQLISIGGMSPLQAPTSATSLGAQVCGLADHKGRLAAGFDADILAVDGDPLTDATALQHIRAVWMRGVRIR